MHLKLEYFYLIFILLNFNQIHCTNTLRPIEIDKNTQVIAEVLHDIVNEFFIKEKVKFHIIVFKSLSTSQEGIFNKFLTTKYYRFSRVIKLHKEHTRFQDIDVIKTSAVFFLRSLDDIIDMEYFYLQIRKGNEPIKYFIYIPNLTYLQLKSSTIFSKLRYLDIFSRFLLQYEFFILDEPGVVTLSTIEWFRVEKCGEAQLTKVNVFDKESGKWMKKLKNYEKFLQYNGCELILMVTVPVNGILTDVSNYAIVNKNQTNFELKGIVPKVFEIVAKVHNFSTSYQPAMINRDSILIIEPNQVQRVPINGSKKVPSVYFFASSNTFRKYNLMKTSHAFVDTSFRIFVTPGELYTPYEKLFLPFDLETWIMLVVTFLTTFLSILVINRLSKSTQTIVYGHRVSTPFWNVVSIFFGISLIRLPSKNFSRFILILFVFFCLIFRTCYQSKLFEFMTNEPRKPPPKTIDELIENGFTLFLMEQNSIEELFNSSYEIRPNIKSIQIREFYNLFITQSQNSSAKLALLVDELLQNHIENSTSKSYDWNNLKDTFLVAHDSFAFYTSSFYYRMFNKIINRLIDTGVMKYLSDNYYTKTPKFDTIYSKPKVLTMDDMMFGFNIWLGFCAISLAGFVGEIFYRVFIKKYRKIKFDMMTNTC